MRFNGIRIIRAIGCADSLLVQGQPDQALAEYEKTRIGDKLKARS